MIAPRIGVSGVVRRWLDVERVAVNAAYVHSMAKAGGVPLVLSQIMGAEPAVRALEGCDGLVLTGGEDVDPAEYGPTLSSSPCSRPPVSVASPCSVSAAGSR